MVGKQSGSRRNEVDKVGIDRNDEAEDRFEVKRTRRGRSINAKSAVMQ